LRIEPAVPYGLSVKRLTLAALGRLTDVATLMKQFPRPLADPVSRYVAALAQGNATEAESALNDAVTGIADPTSSSNGRRQNSTFLIPLLIDHGNAELALRVLDSVTKLNEVMAYDWLMTVRQFSTLRGDPRFKAAEVRSRAQFEEMHKTLVEAKS